MSYPETVAAILRAPSRKVPEVVAKIVPPSDRAPESAVPSLKGPMIEFVRKGGRTQSVYIRTNTAVKVLHITRDDDGNILSLSLNRSY